jgi:MFS family permease
MQASSTATFCLGTGFLLASTIFQPVIFELSNILGRKPAFIIANLLFLVGAIVAATSKEIAQLLIGRTIQGIGAAGPLSLSVVIITDLFPIRDRAKLIGGLNAVWSVGSVTGPIIAAALLRASWVRHVDWPNI